MRNRQLKLYVYLMKQDDPKKCTSARLRRFKLVKPIFYRKKFPRKVIVLNPLAKEVFFRGDKEALEQGGIIVIDCSWKKAMQVFSMRFKGIHRRLPTLIAANPVNYGHAHKLCSAEALAAALYIANFKEEAEKIMEPFKWGHNFIELNRDPLEEYACVEDRDKIRIVEEAYFSP